MSSAKGRQYQQNCITEGAVSEALQHTGRNETTMAGPLPVRARAYALVPSRIDSVPLITMSQTDPIASSSSSSNFQSVFNVALEAYEKTTKNKLLTHPLATQLQSCDSPTAILTVLRDLVKQLDQSRGDNEMLRRWLDPTVNVLFAFSATLGEGVGMVILTVLISYESAL